MPKTIVCPFYMYDKKLTLRCEAGLLEFQTLEQKADYINRYCSALDGYKFCSLAASLEKMYERKYCCL